MFAGLSMRTFDTRHAYNSQGQSSVGSLNWILMLSIFYVTYWSVCEVYLARGLTFVRAISLFRRLETVELTKRSLHGDTAVNNNSNKMYYIWSGSACVQCCSHLSVQLFSVCHQGAIFVNNIQYMRYCAILFTELEFHGEETGCLFPVVHRLLRLLVTGRLQVKRVATDNRTRKASITLTAIVAFSVPYIRFNCYNVNQQMHAVR